MKENNDLVEADEHHDPLTELGAGHQLIDTVAESPYLDIHKNSLKQSQFLLIHTFYKSNLSIKSFGKL